MNKKDNKLQANIKTNFEKTFSNVYLTVRGTYYSAWLPAESAADSLPSSMTKRKNLTPALTFVSIPASTQVDMQYLHVYGGIFYIYEITTAY